MSHWTVANQRRKRLQPLSIDEARFLLVPTEAGSEFQQKYFSSVQQSPEVVLGHAEFAKLLGPGRLSKEIH